MRQTQTAISCCPGSATFGFRIRLLRAPFVALLGVEDRFWYCCMVTVLGVREWFICPTGGLACTAFAIVLPGLRTAVPHRPTAAAARWNFEP